MNQEFPWVPHLVHTWPRWARRDTCSGIPVLPAGPGTAPAGHTHLHHTNECYIITSEPQNNDTNENVCARYLGCMERALNVTKFSLSASDPVYVPG